MAGYMDMAPTSLVRNDRGAGFFALWKLSATTGINVLPESLLHLPLWMIFRHMHINLINVRSTYAS